jgi:oligoribonuclease NrnB/cAMP/cGMP phosphodiesterase (DHH superfamily)
MTEKQKKDQLNEYVCDPNTWKIQTDKMLDKQITAIFEANSLTETLKKTITFKFVLKANNAKDEPEEEEKEIVPIYCSGNYNATDTFQSFIENNKLSEKEWKENSLNYYYFDCEKYNKLFKLDPDKVVAGKYSDEEMKVVGINKGFCCDER